MLTLNCYIYFTYLYIFVININLTKSHTEKCCYDSDLNFPTSKSLGLPVNLSTQFYKVRNL